MKEENEAKVLKEVQHTENLSLVVWKNESGEEKCVYKLQLESENKAYGNWGTKIQKIFGGKIQILFYV